MIHIIMAELKRNQQALSLTDLSKRLQVDQPVLEAMVTMLVRRGYLIETHYEDAAGPCECGCETCPRRASSIPIKTYQLAERPREPFFRNVEQ